MKCFVTGATGFIGSHLASRLAEKGWELNCLARQSSNISLLKDMGANIFRGDIRDKESMRAAMKDCDLVFHIAALYRIGYPKEEEVHDTNLKGTVNVLQLARELGVSRVIYCSSAGVLGKTGPAPANEQFQRSSEFSGPYEWSKYLAHQEAKRFANEGLDVVTLMPGAVFGPGDTSHIGQLIDRHVRQKLPAMVQTRTLFSFVHVKDVADGFILAAEKGRSGESYILCDRVKTLEDLMREVHRITGLPLPRVRVGIRGMRMLLPWYGLMARVSHKTPFVSKEAIRMLKDGFYVYDSTKARRELGWKPNPFEERLRETVDWYMEEAGKR